MKHSPAKSALVILTHGFEELETVAPADLLRRAGAEVVLATTDPRPEPVCGRCGMSLLPDSTLDAVAGRHFDMLVIPGGPGVKQLRRDPRIAALAKEFLARGKPVAAICAAPLVLGDAGLLAGRTFTAHFSARAELPGAGDEPVVVDGDIVTSRGAGTALPFGLALVRILFGPDCEREIREQIMA